MMMIVVVVTLVCDVSLVY